MKFDQVYGLLRDYRGRNGEQVIFLLQKQVMENIYDCVLQTGAKDCIELGTGYGSTTCLIAAALDEMEHGQVTTVDMIERAPIGVRQLAKHTGLSHRIDVVVDKAGYNWYLADLIAQQTKDIACEPCFDFCFLDGAHEWGVDALATFLVAKLLRPGSWIALDDLDIRLRGGQPGWEKQFADRSERELDARQVRMVFDLVLRQHPDFGDFAVTDSGRTGWARKNGSLQDGWRPTEPAVGAGPTLWQETFAAADLIKGAWCSAGLELAKQGSAVAVRAPNWDPIIIPRVGVFRDRAIDNVSLRLRLVEPAEESLQVFWIEKSGETFIEPQSVWADVQASEDWQEVTLCLNRREPRPVHALRIDPTKGPSSFIWESLTISGR